MNSKDTIQYQGSVFSTQIAIVLLASIFFVQFFSLLGVSPSAASILTSPLQSIIDMLLCITALLGIYGLYKMQKFGPYSGLITSASLGVTSCFTLVNSFSTGEPAQSTTFLATVTLSMSILSAMTIFRSGTKHSSGVIVKTVDASPSERRCTIETVDVVKKYLLGSNEIWALNGVTFKVYKGEFLAVMGPSGSGKSTLLNLLGALDKPTSGRVLIDGVDISRLGEEGLAKLRNEKVGFVFQAYNLVARSSVSRNMELPTLVRGYPKEKRLRKVNDLLTIVGLKDKGPRKPKTLSGGEQQRVAIARALINDPEIVLADEPTGNVDSKTGSVIMKFLRKLNLEKETTIIVVTHDPEVANKTDKVIYLRDGKIAKEERVGGKST